ncbi:MAG: molybdopterin converting factor subunit 1 [Planktomarina sp.]
MVDILYFAWVRERIGTGRETIETVPVTVADLITDLSHRSEGHAAAFADPSQLRVAVDQELVPMDTLLKTPREIAIFPPMTGG